MSNLAPVQVPLPLKSWEKGTRYTIGTLLAGAGVAGGYFLFPILAAVFKSGVIALGWMVTLGAGAVATLIAWKFLKSLWPYIMHGTKVAALKLSEQMIKREPVGWLQIYIEDHAEKVDRIVDGETGAKKALTTTVRKGEQYTRERDEAREKAKLAFQKGDRAVAIQWERVVKRRERSLQWIERRKQMLEFIVKALKRMREALEVTLADEKDQLNSYIEEFKMAQDVEPAIRAGLSAMRPDNTQLRIKETAIAELVDRADRTYAELETTLSIFQPIIAAQDLEDDAAMERMAREFAKLEGQMDSNIFGPEGKQQLLSGISPDFAALLAPVKEKVPAKTSRKPSDFDNLIDRK